MDELTTYIADEDPDVVALQETFLRPSDDLNLANYSTHRCDRLTHRGGGTAILVKNSIPHHSIKINTSTVESTTIVIESQPNNITICSLYNPQEPQLAISSQISSRFLEIDPSASSWATSTRSIPLGVQPLTTTQQAMLSFVLFELMASSSQPLMGPQEFLPAAGPPPSTLESPVESTISRLKSTRTCQMTTTLSTLSFRSILQFPSNKIARPSPIVPEAWSSERRKADCFVDNLEESFTENRTPYDDDHIDKVDRTIRRFLNNYSSSIPPLTSLKKFCDIISKLNIRKAPGHDQIKNIALKSLPMNAITHLTKIFNKCLLLQYFPQIWKHCTISLLPKKNKDPKFPLNYRPISLISCVAKLFEKILLSRIQAFSDSNQIIPDFQHEFRKKTSTCHQLLRATNSIIDGFNNHRTTGGIFLDVEKTFDRVWHNGLIFKLIQVNSLHT
ncbi:RNA-directed DNA polymerase from mobile element jockey [Trichonephila clavipes]|uniref:RNA-directed DNA polymerase from mobile element jockey n=1 Tax=Trichonephila clavipes TaxID=2585209 RepID=A0A8X6S0B9_TRICX|nr:RNA-directed DNA polymerase from mobile element jockey [Trichonephila clavipes]